MMIWGFMSQFLYDHSNYVFRAFGVLLAAVMLWDVMFRGQLGVSISFLEEMWARNLGHLFVTPLRPYEWVAALLAMSLMRVLIGVVPAALLAILALSLFDLFAGLPLVAFFAVLLVMGWALGMAICGMILRHGMGAESLAWLAVFTLSPISAVYYPVSILPHWLQHVAWALPSTYVFEGMRAVIVRGRLHGRLPPDRGGARRGLAGARRRRVFLGVSGRPPARRPVADGRMSKRRHPAGPSTAKPCRSNAGRAAGDSRKSRKRRAFGFVLPAVSATG